MLWIEIETPESCIGGNDLGDWPHQPTADSIIFGITMTPHRIWTIPPAKEGWWHSRLSEQRQSRYGGDEGQRRCRATSATAGSTEPAITVSTLSLDNAAGSASRSRPLMDAVLRIILGSPIIPMTAPACKKYAANLPSQSSSCSSAAKPGLAPLKWRAF